jgi:arginyl-tRNA synthetase
MYDYKEPWKVRIAGAVNTLLHDAGQEEVVKPADVVAEIPPKPEMGDLGFPMFGYAKRLRKGPPQIAALVCEKLAAQGGSSFTAEGP